MFALLAQVAALHCSLAPTSSSAPIEAIEVDCGAAGNGIVRVAPDDSKFYGYLSVPIGNNLTAKRHVAVLYRSQDATSARFASCIDTNKKIVCGPAEIMDYLRWEIEEQ